MQWPLEKLWMTIKLGRDSAKQVEAALAWINTITQENDRILVEFLNYRRVFCFEFPLRFGDLPKPLREQDSEITFIIRRPSSKNTPLDEKWQKIFFSPDFEILESKERKAAIPPLRWRLTDEEKRLALKIARDSLELFLSKSERLSQNYFRALPPRFYLRTDLDVALWTSGRLRGSYVIENTSLGEGIAEAATGASRDARFKPLAVEELLHTRIEITIMHNLRIPLSSGERRRNVIYPEKGYLFQRGQNKGWYLPEVFNVRRFRNLEGFLGDLAEEKAGLERAAYKNAVISIFEVDDFIESSDHQKALSLSGPVVKAGFGELEILNSRFQILDSRLRMAADWLCRIQEPDGNIPPIINPLTGRQTQIDWPRLAFTAWALAEFGKATKEEKYTKAAEKSFSYLKECLISNFQYPISNFELTLAYFGQLSFALGKLNDAATAANRILGRLSTLNFEPIAFAQIASFLKIIINNNLIVRAESRTILNNLFQILKENFEKTLKSRQPISLVSGCASNGVNLAVWAELVNTFAGIDQEFYSKVADWLKAQQLESGAFPESTTSNFVYTRGTGKIFEVLALDPEVNKEAIVRALHWLLSMQYNEENTFFVPDDIRSKIVGGFRHDYLNPEVWIDAAGHILLGGIKILREY